MSSFLDRPELSKEVAKLHLVTLPANTGYLPLKDEVLKRNFPAIYHSLKELAECFKVPFAEARTSIGLISDQDTGYKSVKSISSPMVVLKNGDPVIRWGELTIPLTAVVGEKMTYGKGSYFEASNGLVTLVNATWSQEHDIVPYLSLPVKMKVKDAALSSIVAAYNNGSLGDWLQEMGVTLVPMALLKENTSGYKVTKVGAIRGISKKTGKDYDIPWFTVEGDKNTYKATGKVLKSAIEMVLEPGLSNTSEAVDWTLDTYSLYKFQQRDYINYSLEVQECDPDLFDMPDQENGDEILF